MDPPHATTDQTGVIGTTLLPMSLPTAVNCCVALMPINAGPGVTVIVANAPARIGTVAVPEIVPLVAFTELVNVPAVDPAVNKPVLLTVPPPATTDHVGVMVTTLPSASVPTATNCCVLLMTNDAGLGVTVMVASGRASVGDESQAVNRTPAVATASPAAMARGLNVRSDRVRTDSCI